MNIRAKQLIEKVGGNLIGIVLNNINMAQDESYYYYSGYYHDYYSKNDDDDATASNGAARDKSRGDIKPKILTTRTPANDSTVILRKHGTYEIFRARHLGLAVFGRRFAGRLRHLPVPTLTGAGFADPTPQRRRAWPFNRRKPTIMLRVGDELAVTIH